MLQCPPINPSLWLPSLVLHTKRMHKIHKGTLIYLLYLQINIEMHLKGTDVQERQFLLKYILSSTPIHSHPFNTLKSATTCGLFAVLDFNIPCILLWCSTFYECKFLISWKGTSPSFAALFICSSFSCIWAKARVVYVTFLPIANIQSHSHSAEIKSSTNPNLC